MLKWARWDESIRDSGIKPRNYDKGSKPWPSLPLTLFPNKAQPEGDIFIVDAIPTERETKRKRRLSKKKKKKKQNTKQNTTNPICERSIQVSENFATIYPDKGKKQILLPFSKWRLFGVKFSS